MNRASIAGLGGQTWPVVKAVFRSGTMDAIRKSADANSAMPVVHG